MAINIEMIATTTSSSMSVKPLPRAQNRRPGSDRLERIRRQNVEREGELVSGLLNMAHVSLECATWRMTKALR